MKIALLATGDEIIFGDIVNSNGQKIAQMLRDTGFEIGMHITVGDDESAIVNAIKFLQQEHQAIILIGGLGPTSDDRTRFALANALNLPLQMDDPSWQHIVNRLNKIGLAADPANRQQALFPENATILLNPNGTANGCFIEKNKQLFFMLPGPPSECLPMFQEYGLKFLQEKLTIQTLYHHRWRLFGVAEGEIAAKLDQLLSDVPCQTAYRWDYPYLDFKIRTHEKNILPEVICRVDALVAPFQICPAEKIASEVFLHWLEQEKKSLVIFDEATHGFLESFLCRAQNLQQLYFIHKKEEFSFYPDSLQIQLQGLQELWQKQTLPALTSLSLLLTKDNQTQSFQQQFSYRDRRVNKAASEWACFKIREFFKN